MPAGGGRGRTSQRRLRAVAEGLTCGVWARAGGSGCRRGRQLRTGADLSLVTVGFSWTLVKGFLRREESGVSAPRAPACRRHPPGPLGAAGLLGEPGGCHPQHADPDTPVLPPPAATRSPLPGQGGGQASFLRPPWARLNEELPPRRAAQHRPPGISRRVCLRGRVRRHSPAHASRSPRVPEAGLAQADTTGPRRTHTGRGCLPPPAEGLTTRPTEGSATCHPRVPHPPLHAQGHRRCTDGLARQEEMEQDEHGARVQPGPCGSLSSSPWRLRRSRQTGTAQDSRPGDIRRLQG